MKEQLNLAKTIFERHIDRRQLLIGGAKASFGLAAGVFLGIDKDPEFLPESLLFAPENLRFRKIEKLSLKLLQQSYLEQQNNRPELAEGTLNREFAFQVGELINQFRLENGLHPLVRHPALTAAAEGYAKFIIENNLLSSLANPQVAAHSMDGQTPTERAAAQGYTGIAVGENLAGAPVSPKITVEDWKGSPGHRKMLLAYTNKDLGIGLYKDPSKPGGVCVADFGIPRQSLPIELQVESGYTHAAYIWHFDNQTQRWSWYLYGLPTEKNTLTQFESGKIYFLFSRASGPFSMGPVPKMQIKPGWNQFVWP